MIVLRAKCGLEIPQGLTLPVKRCHICGGQHSTEELEAVRIEGQQLQVSKARPRRLTQPLNRDGWPFWAWSLKWMRSKADKGAGDTIQRIAASMGGEQFKKLSKRIGLPCRCAERQAEWNKSYPYEADQ